ncbi:hypothetical protein LCGC14_2343640 [marine sediment metagenome]|uniref:Uncharacterized protein n=1 Tax=marine sediment metagenome TaxID=412755 RepID=A0A0F9F6C0_9ZZZZ
MMAVEQAAAQHHEDQQRAITAAFQNLAVEMIESGVKSASATHSKTEREKELAFLSSEANPCYLLMDVSEVTIRRIVESVPDNTYEWWA